VSEESTTPDLEELARRSLEAANRRDWDAAAASYAPDAVWDGSPMDGEVIEGREAIRGLFDAWFAAYEDIEIELEGFNDLGNGVTLNVLVTRGGLAGSSGGELLEFRFGQVAEWRGELIARLGAYTDLDEARAAAERLAEERG
jgi:ketosteroid isomerase-like protein